ncbi:hypothetical protein DFS34DRAFT_366851 [Phlyctochytrium arcticum]|nr:hypothetical protein DFS34DRAFT_366851 [Phlyctochytrium arcticum]
MSFLPIEFSWGVQKIGPFPLFHPIWFCSSVQHCCALKQFSCTLRILWAGFLGSCLRGPPLRTGCLWGHFLCFCFRFHVFSHQDHHLSHVFILSNGGFSFHKLLSVPADYSMKKMGFSICLAGNSGSHVFSCRPYSQSICVHLAKTGLHPSDGRFMTAGVSKFKTFPRVDSVSRFHILHPRLHLTRKCRT